MGNFNEMGIYNVVTGSRDFTTSVPLSQNSEVDTRGILVAATVAAGILACRRAAASSPAEKNVRSSVGGK